MLYTKPIKSNREEADGLRISVMSRHTLNDGVTPDPEIMFACYDEWRPELAPPLALIGDYYKRNLPWERFARLYIDFLGSPEAEPNVRDIAELALEKNVTLLCIEETPERCHRRLLAERCIELEPGLQLELR